MTANIIKNIGNVIENENWININKREGEGEIKRERKRQLLNDERYQKKWSNCTKLSKYWRNLLKFLYWNGKERRWWNLDKKLRRRRTGASFI